MSGVRETGQWLADQLTANRADIKALSAPQLGSSSIEAGAIEEYDVDGTLVSVTGEQFDGTHAAVTLGGPVPPEPAAPSVSAGPGQITVRWSGLFADDALSPMDFSHVAVHASRDEAFDPDNTTQYATITGESGDAATVLLDAGDWSVLLVAVSKAGKWSDPSDPVQVVVPDNVLSDIQDTLSTFDDSLDGLQTSVDGKNGILNRTTIPDADGTAEGDRWQMWTTLDAGGKLVGSWRWTGTEWLIEAMDPSYLPLVDIGAGTFGLLSGGRLIAKSITAAALEALLILTSDIIAGDPNGSHARMTPSGFFVRAPRADGVMQDMVRMGTPDPDGDLIQVNDAAGNQKASIDALGNISAQNADIDGDLILGGDSVGAKLRAIPQGFAGWQQFPPPSGGWPTLGSAGGEVGLFEIGWETPETEARMYAVNVPPLLIKSLSGSTGRHGLVMRMTTDGSPPSIPGNSQIIARSYSSGVPAGDYATGYFNNVLVSSKNGPYIRIMVSLIATVGSSIDGTIVEISVEDKGILMPTTGSVTTGGVTPPTTPVVAPPTNPVVTKTVTYSSTSVKSFQGNNSAYAFDTAKGYQGLSPAGYGNLKSLWTFPSITSLLAGATVNKIEAYFYFEHWYNGSGGTARIVAHGNSGQPTTYSSLILAISSPNWPRGAGRWVTIPSSLYAGFKSGTYKGFGLEGDGTYKTYGIANAAKIRVTYTK